MPSSETSSTFPSCFKFFEPSSQPTITSSASVRRYCERRSAMTKISLQRVFDADAALLTRINRKHFSSRSNEEPTIWSADTNRFAHGSPFESQHSRRLEDTNRFA